MRIVANQGLKLEGGLMKIVLDIPDVYLFRWNDLKDKLNYSDMDSFILGAIGLGIRTINQAVNVLNAEENDNVVQFDQDYYWKQS